MKAINVDNEIRRLSRLAVSELRGEFERVWGEPTSSNNRPYLIKRIAWRMQAAKQGGLSERAREMAKELARDVDLRVRPPTPVHAAYSRAQGESDKSETEMPRAGSRLVRMYKGRRIEVEVLEHGFVWDGREFASLTAVAHAVTGSNWNGRLFFGLANRKAET